MKLKWIVLSLFYLFMIEVSAQDVEEHIVILEEEGVRLDSLDREWLKVNSLFLIDMASLAKSDSDAMNMSIIQISTKLLSNDLTEISDEEAIKKSELITKIIHGAFDDHGLKDEKLLSAMSWYNMIVKEIGI